MPGATFPFPSLGRRPPSDALDRPHGAEVDVTEHGNLFYVLGCTSAPEKQAQQQDLLDRLGPHKRGKSCLYVTRLNKVDREVLEQLIAFDKAAMDEKYPA